jgi:diguanylate cyclase (GGDEF)-like protein/PAS domain S-box-containing protein
MTPTDPTADDPAALRAELERLRLLANSVPAGVAYFERAGYTCLLANKVYAQTFGHDERSVIGLTVAQIIGEAAAAQIRPMIDRVEVERRAHAYERAIPGADGQRPRHIEVTLVPHIDDGEQLVGAFVLIADITRHRLGEARLRQSEERLAKFMHASAEGIVFHKGGFITDVNPPLLQLLGYTLDEMMGRKTLEFVAPEERAKVAAVIAAGAEITYDSLAMHRDGRAVPVEYIVRTIEHQDTEQRMTIVRDRRDRVAAAARIHHLAHHDALTGLPNRVSFDERVAALIAGSSQHRRQGDSAAASAAAFALLFIDLDHFKRVNDSLGHVVGDALLQTVARRIASALRTGDLVARFGGDEFAVLLTGAPPRDAVQEVAHKLLQLVGESVQVLGSDISVTPSIGIALYPDDGETVTELIKNADTAMYEAKRAGRATSRFFEPQMATRVYAELALEAQLAQAIREREFVLHYQPQLDLATNPPRLVGVEALIRWQHPQRGLLEPSAFLPVAEARRQILAIGQWVIQQSLEQSRRWREQGLLGVPIAVNLTAPEFQRPGFVESVRAALAAAGSTGADLELELTERMLVDDLSAVRPTLLELRALGVRLTVDDFGTGYSSLGLLLGLPIQRLKVDRSFIEDLPGDAGSAAIARAIVQIGNSLGLDVIAEGVETEAQRDWCLANGCREVQGFLTGRPMAAAAFEGWLRGRIGLPLSL